MVTKVKRQSVEEKIDHLTTALFSMQDMMKKKGFFNEGPGPSTSATPRKRNKAGKNVAESESDNTIYHNAVEHKLKGKDDVDPNDEMETEVTFNLKCLRESTSSEQVIDTSDEFMDPACFNTNVNIVADECAKGKKATDKARDLIKQAESSRARMYGTPGNQIEGVVDRFLSNIRESNNQYQHSVLVDENYLVIGGHLDKGLVEKIINNEYVDFARLLPRDRATLREEDHRMEIVNKGGFTYFVPVADRECGTISSFHKWEQAFRIFSKVYTGRYPQKASELIQYNHIIFTAAQMFVWDNVYLYDKEFRLHISNFPNRSWLVILQQAWSMYLKDRIRYEQNHFNNRNASTSSAGKGRKEICERFNVGKFTTGKGCKYDHRCKECGKWGHGAHICHKKVGTANAGASSSVNHSMPNNGNATNASK